MNEYNIHFEIYGKKMKTTIFADSDVLAIKALRKKITIHSIKEVASSPITDKDIDDVNYLASMLGIKL